MRTSKSRVNLVISLPHLHSFFSGQRSECFAECSLRLHAHENIVRHSRAWSYSNGRFLSTVVCRQTKLTEHKGSPHALLTLPGRFLEPPKELPSIADDHDDDDDGDTGLGGGDATLEFETLASANRGDSGNLKCEDADHCDNEPELIVVSSPAAAAATKGGGCGGTFNGCNPDGGREESDSDGDDDEVRRAHPPFSFFT